MNDSMIYSSETHPLRDYTVAKQEVTALVRSAKQFWDKQGNVDLVEQYQALLVKLAEDRFNLAVVGQFKRGKSSLMNAVIGRDLLPTGLLPLTSAITALCYGPRERVVLRRKGWVIEPEVSLRDLPDYVTERGNPGNEKGVIEARVELPDEFLRRGLHFIDTPGIGSSKHENTVTTYAFLPEADAVIWVTSAEAPLSEAEQEFLRDVRQLVRRIFVVVNKIDLLANHERDQVLGYIRSGIEQVMAATEIRLFPLSARMGLEAKLNRNEEQLRQSGLPAFESALASFLAEEKGRAFLVASLDRALGLLANQEKVSDQLADLRIPMETLRSALLAGSSLALPKPETERATVPVADISAMTRKAPTARTAQRKERANSQDMTCRICAAQSEAVFDFFAHWQYALVTTPAAREAFTAAHGFCHVHTWQFQQMASPVDIADGYAALIDAAATVLREMVDPSSPPNPARIRDLLSGPPTCPACHVLEETAKAEIPKFLAWVATDTGRQAYSRSVGLCLPHLQAVLAAAPPQEIVEFLVREQIRHLEKTSEDMQSFVLKRDALRRGLIRSDEENAWWRALIQLTGERTAQYCWPESLGDKRSDG